MKYTKTQIAREFRKEAMPQEAIVWQYLRKKNLSGYKFRRQHVIGDYIVDFYCQKLRLVIEIDGSWHKGREEFDWMRDEDIRMRGIEVIRIKNLEVQRDVGVVMRRVEGFLAGKSPLPQPLSHNGKPFR